MFCSVSHFLNQNLCSLRYILLRFPVNRNLSMQCSAPIDGFGCFSKVKICKLLATEFQLELRFEHAFAVSSV